MFDRNNCNATHVGMEQYMVVFVGKGSEYNREVIV